MRELDISCFVYDGIESCMFWERFEETTLLQTSLTKAGWTSGSCSASIIHGSWPLPGRHFLWPSFLSGRGEPRLSVCVFFPKSSAFEVQVHTLWLILSLPSALPLFNARFFSCSLCTESSICLFVLSVRVLHVEFRDSCLCSSCRTPVIAWSKVHTRRTRSLSRRCTVNVSHRLLELPHGFPRFHFARFFIHSK